MNDRNTESEGFIRRIGDARTVPAQPPQERGRTVPAEPRPASGEPQVEPGGGRPSTSDGNSDKGA